MRLIAGESAPHRVYLDGVCLRYVFACDTVEGWADVALLDDDGEMTIDPEKNEVARQRLFGEVTVERLQ